MGAPSVNFRRPNATIRDRPILGVRLRGRMDRLTAMSVGTAGTQQLNYDGRAARSMALASRPSRPRLVVVVRRFRRARFAFDERVMLAQRRNPPVPPRLADKDRR